MNWAHVSSLIGWADTRVASCKEFDLMTLIAFHLVNLCLNLVASLILKPTLCDTNGWLSVTRKEKDRTGTTLRSSFTNKMTSSNVSFFRATDPLCGEFTGPRWIPLTKASDAELWYFLWCAWINGWVNTCEAGGLRRHGAHYFVIVMKIYLKLAHG